MTTIGSRQRRRAPGDDSGSSNAPHTPPSGRGKPPKPAEECRRGEEDWTPSIATEGDTAADPPPAGSSLRAAVAEARFRLAWGLSTRLSPVLGLAARLFAPAPAAPGRHAKRNPVIPRRWYVSHIFFWLGSGTACWFQFRRRDRAAARRHLIRSIWIPPLVWLAALTAIGTAIPDEAIIDMVRNAPYARAP